jgi:hypothetical protein
MLGTFAAALEARQIDASDGKLTGDVTGEVEEEDRVLIIRRIHVSMRLRAVLPGRLLSSATVPNSPPKHRDDEDRSRHRYCAANVDEGEA